MKDNWREFVFYLKNKPRICAPTYFSLFGLINFQKTGRALSEPEEIKLFERLDFAVISHLDELCYVNS